MAVVRGELTAGQIQRAAHEIAAAEGIGAVSMRRVADAIGVWPTALYHHVGDKQQLVQLVLDAVLAEVDVPDDALPWDAWLEAFGRGCREVLQVHPGVAAYLLEHGNVSSAALEVGDRAIGVLRRDGFPVTDAAMLYGTFFTFVLSRTLQEERRDAGTTNRARQVLESSLSDEGSDLGNWVAAAQVWLAAPDDAMFEHGVATFLAGARTRLAAGDR